MLSNPAMAPGNHGPQLRAGSAASGAIKNSVTGGTGATGEEKAID